jgi:hypothetical protein
VTYTITVSITIEAKSGAVLIEVDIDPPLRR